MKGFLHHDCASLGALFGLCVYAISVPTLVRAQQTVYQVIASKPELSLFANAIALASLDQDSILTDSTKVLTVFVPNNDAVLKDPIFSNYTAQPGWDVHLKELVGLHVVEGSALTRPAIFAFEGESTELNSTSGTPLPLSKDNFTVSGQTVLDEGTSASNGVVLTVDGVFQNHWRNSTLASLTETFAPLLSEIVTVTGFDAELESLTPFGTTFVAALDGFFQGSSGASALLDLQDASKMVETYGTLLYNVIDENLYEEEMLPGMQYLVTPRSAKAQMWVTMDEDGKLRFNDAVVKVSELAENGVFYTAEKFLTPPGIIDFLGITGFYSNLNTINAYELFTSTNWEGRNLAASIGYDPATKFTLFAPIDGALSGLPLEEQVRLLDPIWSHHLEDLLKTWLVQGTFTLEELKERALSSPDGYLELRMLSGTTTTLTADSVSGDLFIDQTSFISSAEMRDVDLSIADGGSFFQPANIRGVDGLIHVIGTILIPPSLQYSVYGRAILDPELGNFTSLIDLVDFGNIIDNFSPVTVFAPTNPSWVNFEEISPEATTELVASHVFKGLLSAELLRTMDGQAIKSVNDKQFLVNVVDNVITIRGIGVYSEATKATVLDANILGSTGILHRVDGIIQDTPFGTNTSAPTTSTLANITSPTSVNITLATSANISVVSDSAIENATYAPSEEAFVAETVVPSDTQVPTTSETDMETLAPTADSSEAGTVVSTFMVKNETNPPSNGEPVEETVAPATSSSNTTSNNTNATMAPPAVQEDDEDAALASNDLGGLMTSEPSASPVTMIEVDAETSVPTVAPPAFVTVAPTTGSGEQVALGFSAASSRQCFMSLSSSGVVAIAMLLSLI